jgi:DNA-binding transcriptional MerR regulator
MAEETLYTIGQLAELASVTPRTIRYYTSEGLLPRPDARGQYALYSSEHLLRLQLIGRLKEAFLPLGEIKARLEQLNIDQIRELLVGEQQITEPPASSAAEYLSALLSRQQNPAPAGKQLAEGSATYAAPAQAAFAPQQRLSAGDPSPAGPMPVYGFVAPAAPAPAPPVAGQPPGLLRRLLPHRQAHAESDAPATDQESFAQQGESWRRIPLAPGVELHVRQPIAAQLQERVQALIALAKDMNGGD